MNKTINKTLNLNDTDFLAKGSERACYTHPQDKDKAIKLSYEQNIGRDKQSNIEIKYYEELIKKDIDWKHLPKYYGEITTNQGNGFIIEMIRDYDGQVSKSFAYYLNNNGLEPYTNMILEYKNFFLKHHIIFNYGMMPKNILIRKNSETEAHLVLIDGLGDITYFTFPNKIPFLARKKIIRRWNKFVHKYLNKNIKSWKE